MAAIGQAEAARAAYRSASEALASSLMLPADAIGAVGTVTEDGLTGRTQIIPVRRYLPVDGDDGGAGALPGPRPGILFFHGGGCIVGDLDTHDALCRRLVAATGLQLVSVAYRLAPEHRFPAAVEDAVDAHAMLLERAAIWGIDADRIALAGDEAGATLALVTALHARDLCRPMPIAQILFQPIAAAKHRLPAANANARATDKVDWRNTPLSADDLSALPPTLLTGAGDTGLIADRLIAAGVDVERRDPGGETPGLFGIGTSRESVSATIEAVAVFLNACLVRAG